MTAIALDGSASSSFAAREDVRRRDQQQRDEDAHLHRDRLENERGEDEEHHRDAERDREVESPSACPRIEELVERQRGADRDRRVEDVRMRPADDPDGQRSGDECGQLTLHSREDQRQKTEIRYQMHQA